MPKVNLTIGFDKFSYEDLEILRKNLGKGSKAEVIRAAIMLLKRTSEIQEKGGKIIVQENDGREREILLI